MKTFAGLLAAAAALLLALPAGARSGPAGLQAPTAWVLLGPDGARIARALTTAPDCPSLSLDGRAAPMTVRAAAGAAPLRPTRSPPADSKPSVFAETVCEATIPASVRRARLLPHRGAAGAPLPMPPARITRIVVIGDTGCRMKSGPGGAFQACNDPARYPFARVAASAAAWKPQLVVHVGDYHYRENACQPDKADCAGSVWGYGSDAWRADFLDPGAPLLRAAPLALARGNHESCNRGGQGWMRYFDVVPFSPARSCDLADNDAEADYSAPFAIPLGGGAQLIMFDSSNAPFGQMPDGDIRLARYRDDFLAMQALAARAPHNILVDHHPLLNLGAFTGADGKVNIVGGNPGLLQVFGPLSPTYAPKGVQLILSGHVHLWEAADFTGDFPAQIVAGFSGTDEDIVPLPVTPPPGFEPAPHAAIRALSSWVDGFGFMTMTRTGPDRWRIEVRDVAGKVVNTCGLKGRALTCRLAQVPRHA
jgi:hypothetical protein